MRRLRIVLAEDHQGVAEQLRALLADEYDVEILRDGWSLVTSLERQCPDALVTDISIPGVSGLVAARAARNLYPSLPIVFVTVSNTDDVIKRAMSLGAVGYVLKCDAGEELPMALRAVLGGQSFLSMHVRTSAKKR